MLAVAFVLGTLIGFERQWRQRSAGLRTTTLVATGAAAFADMGLRLRGVEGATQIIAYIVSGIGFLGAGVILRTEPTSAASTPRRRSGVPQPSAPFPAADCWPRRLRFCSCWLGIRCSGPW